MRSILRDFDCHSVLRSCVDSILSLVVPSPRSITDRSITSNIRGAGVLVIVPGIGVEMSPASYPMLIQLIRVIHTVSPETAFAVCMHSVAGCVPYKIHDGFVAAHLPETWLRSVIETNAILESHKQSGYAFGPVVALVIGANDIVNPRVMWDGKCTLKGMPVCEVWKATSVLVLTKDVSDGSAGMQNPLFSGSLVETVAVDSELKAQVVKDASNCKVTVMSGDASQSLHSILHMLQSRGLF
ncbi:H+-translocating NAD(P) transhydrogenase [Pelomyxa schiedti]|nr:H+-translocating NAD(P) transhydrogenase [Pelomyxa schiedti]